MNAKSLVVAMMGLGVSTMGCIQTATNEELSAMDLAAYETQRAENPTGGDTNNHYAATPYHAQKYKLLRAMNHSLRNCNPFCMLPGLTTNIYNTGILDTEEGRDLFEMAIECALPEGVYVTQTNPSRTYTGKGLMTTTASWSSSSLTTEQKEDVFRCVVARVNAFGKSVPIVLSGKNVRDQRAEGEAGATMTPDALWDVKIRTTTTSLGKIITTIDEYAWPLAQVTPDEPTGNCWSVTTAMELRVCDQDPSTCSFDVRDTAATDCYQYPYPDDATRTYYQCNPGNPAAGRPVVQSWVDPNYISEVYPLCPYDTPLLIDLESLYIPFDPGYPMP